ncbi:MAG: intradiol ring-cleavage dioxygenase [Bauldia sp.]|nr:intradiol ring-cleavage dioxygenase [Bauldia sp.]
MPAEIGRRRFLKGIVTAGVAGLSLSGLTRAAEAQGLSLPPTLACGDDDDEVTEAQTEGPYFTPNSPERTNFREAGFAGTNIVLTGLVVTRSCRPVPQALVELWHCDDGGTYDNAGYKGRGHTFTDALGTYRFETIVPGLYPGRTRHFHLKFQAPNNPVLTTQFYFPGEPGNLRDGIFSDELLLEIASEPELTGWFTTVLDIA